MIGRLYALLMRYLGPYAIAIFFIVFAVWGLVQLRAGYIGIEYHWSAGWAIFFLLLAWFSAGHLILPVTIGSFFGATDVWGWHWVYALMFAAPFQMALLIAYVFDIAQAGKRRL